MQKLKVEEVSEFPPLVRGNGSRNREEKEMFIKLLQSGKRHKVAPEEWQDPERKENKKEFDAMQQRIRNYAHSIGVEVQIRNRVTSEGALYLVGIRTSDNAGNLEKNDEPTKVQNLAETDKSSSGNGHTKTANTKSKATTSK